MSANQARFRVATMARVFGVSPSGYYAWRRRPPSARARADAELRARVQAIHGRSRGTYGAPRIHAELTEGGVAVSRKRVARVMRSVGVAGVSRRRGPRTTRRNAQARPAPDRVERRFEADAPNRLWVADITYVPTLAGFLYLAIVLDVFSRRVVGWAMAGHLRTALVVEALEMAVDQRRPVAVIHHSDQGCQYTSLAFGARCRERGVALSMGSVGDCFDNGRWTNGGRRASITPIKVAFAGLPLAGRGVALSAVGDCFDNAMAESFFATRRAVDARCRRTPKHGQRCSSSSRGGTTRGGVTPRSATSRHWSSNGSIRPALWTVPGLWTPYGRPQVRWIPRCARDPHRPQKLMLMEPLAKGVFGRVFA